MRPPIAPGDVFAGRYEIKSRLGEGGFGSVFEATQRSTGQMPCNALSSHTSAPASSSGVAWAPTTSTPCSVALRRTHPSVTDLTRGRASSTWWGLNKGLRNRA